MISKTVVCANFVAACLLLCGPLHAQERLSLSEIKPPTFGGDTKELTLSAIVTDVRVGGAGRFVVLEMKSLRKLAILDVNQAKIVGYIPLRDDSTVFAVGATKLVMVSTESDTVSRWDLATQKEEQKRDIYFESFVNHLLLGSNSDGPVIAATDRRLGRNPYNKHRSVMLGRGAYSIDVSTLEPEKLSFGHAMHGCCGYANARVSANGSTIAFGGTTSGRQAHGFVKVDQGWEHHSLRAKVGFLFPSPDGRIIHTWAGPLTKKMRTLSGPAGAEVEYDESASSTCPPRIPAIHGPFVLSVSGGVYSEWRDRQPEKVSLSLEGDKRALATIPNLSTVFKNRDDRDARDGFTLDKKLTFIPRAKLVIQVSGDSSKVRLVKFDHEAALNKANVDFLVVRSHPPLHVKVGEKFSYQVQALSNSDDISYSLESGPKGMRMSKAGFLTWDVTAEAPYLNDVIVSASAQSDQQTFQAFKLRVADSTISPSLPASIEVTPAAMVQPVKTTRARIGAKGKDVVLPASITHLVAGAGGRYLFAHLQSLKKIAVIDVSEGVIKKFLPASDDKTLVTAGAIHAFVFNLSQGVVSRYRLDTLEREFTILVPFPNGVQSASMGSNSDGPMILRTSDGESKSDKCSFHFLDTTTMNPLAVNWPLARQPDSAYRDENRIQVSSNGRAFCVSDVGVLQLNGDKVSYVVDKSRSPSVMITSPDGDRLISEREIFNSAMHPVGKLEDKLPNAVTGVTGNYFVSFAGVSSRSSRGPVTKHSGKLYRFGVDGPIATIQDLFSPVKYWQSLHDQVFLIPNAKVIAVRASTNDRIALIPVDFDRALDKSGINYLIVESHAPTQAALNRTYTYDLSVKSKHGGVKFKLDAAPKGMTISRDGRVSWLPTELKKISHDVIISVSDASGQSAYHSFSIEVR